MQSADSAEQGAWGLLTPLSASRIHSHTHGVNGPQARRVPRRPGVTVLMRENGRIRPEIQVIISAQTLAHFREIFPAPLACMGLILKNQ